MSSRLRCEFEAYASDSQRSLEDMFIVFISYCCIWLCKNFVSRSKIQLNISPFKREQTLEYTMDIHGK